MQPEDSDILNNDIVNIETAMADANRVMCAHGLQARAADAAMAARAAFDAQVTECDLTPVPPELAIVIAQVAFAATWNSTIQ